MDVKSGLRILLVLSVTQVSTQEEDDDYYYNYASSLNCSVTEEIKGGNVTYSQGGLEGSVLTYHCGPGRYPFPVSKRLCEADGLWSPMRLPSGRLVSGATCKDILCPGQLQLDHGDFWPRDPWFRAGSTQSFSCHDGFTLTGSAQRNCTISGGWTGTTPVCDDHAGDCNDPGIPPGALRSAGRFQTGATLTYRCESGLALLGSAESVCLESREWSGATPRCQGLNSFDSPSVVAGAMAGSLAGAMDVLTPDSKKEKTTFARTFRVGEGSRINVYILLDTSGSIRKEDFEQSRTAAIALIKKLDTYEVQIKYHVLSFASSVRDIVNITDSDVSGDADQVIWNLLDFDYRSHGHKTGTNIYAALHRVNVMIGVFKKNRHSNHFNETQNIILIQTDGFSNTGSKPQTALAQIRQLLGYDVQQDHTHETKLDVYVFGIGRDVDRLSLNSLASNKRNEEHIFILESYKTLGEVFNSIISDESVTRCGIAQEKVKEQHMPVYTKPWHVILPSVSCSGSIVNEHWVLTAAHCFVKKSSDEVPEQVKILYGEGEILSDRVIIHPKYNIRALKHRNVSEFYDYDVALIQINKSIPLSWQARPICLPCTVPGSRAMKKIKSTCQQHRKELLPHKASAVSFIHKNSLHKETHVQLESERPGCVEKARKTLRQPTDVTLNEYVPRRFLCSGGTKGYQDSVTCKGDSGGALFLQKRQRYFQVGIVSWGTTNTCDNLGSGGGSRRPPPDARDFHIDVFEVMPWLRQHLDKDIQFLPEDD